MLSPNCLRAFFIHVQIDQGRTDCMSEVNISEQNLAYSRAVYLAHIGLNCKIKHAVRFSSAA